MLTYEYKLYSSKRNLKLDAMLEEACYVWNHALALQKRYYSLYRKYCSCARLKAHFAKRISRCRLHSQMVQEILDRLDLAYRRFFDRLSRRPPKFKRSHLGEYFLYVVTDAVAQPCRKSHDGASVGMDFGLKTYLTLSDGTRVANPLFLKQGIKDLKRKSREFSRAACRWDRTNPDGSHPKGSHIVWESGHRKARRLELERLHEDIRNRRDDWQWKLAHELCRRYDILCIEDLQLSGMSRLWGRKMSDLAFGSFVQKLEHTASRYGCRVVKIDRYYPSSRTCNVCQYVNELLSLSDRSWICPACGTHHDRDANAAINILRRGIASSGSTCKTRLAGQGASATGESH